MSCREDLDELAGPLTLKQRLFTEALAADPTRNKTKSARAAGCGKGAAVTAVKWLKLAKVQAYLAALTTEVVRLDNARRGSAVRDGAVVLDLLWRQAEGELPSTIVQRSAKGVIQRFKMLDSLIVLGRFYGVWRR